MKNIFLVFSIFGFVFFSTEINAQTSMTRCRTYCYQDNIWPLADYEIDCTDDSLIKCDTACDTCKDYGCVYIDRKLKCATCGNYYFFVKNNDWSCYATCPQGYYASGLYCESCPYYCGACSDSATCTECEKNYFLYEGSCSRDCPEGYLGLDKICQAGVTECGDYHFPSTTSNVCWNCIDYCMKCENIFSCLECEAGAYLYNQKCFKQCPNTYYGDDSTKICTKCTHVDPNCELCQNSTYCDTCNQNAPYYFSVELGANKCVEECPETYYLDTKDNKCDSCSSNCKNCTSINSKGETVYGEGYCVACTNNYFSYFTEETYPYIECLSTCPEAYFPNKATGACQSCTENCLECGSATNCYKCSGDLLVMTDENEEDYCTAEIPEYSYYANETHILSCLSGCTKCTNGDDCSACQSGLYLLSSEVMIECVYSCPTGTVANSSSNRCIILDSSSISNDDEDEESSSSGFPLLIIICGVAGFMFLCLICIICIVLKKRNKKGLSQAVMEIKSPTTTTLGRGEVYREKIKTEDSPHSSPTQKITEKQNRKTIILAKEKDHKMDKNLHYKDKAATVVRNDFFKTKEKVTRRHIKHKSDNGSTVATEKTNPDVSTVLQKYFPEIRYSHKFSQNFCPLCYANFTKKEKIRESKKKCKHIFHSKCFEQHLKKYMNIKDAECPDCFEKFFGKKT